MGLNEGTHGAHASSHPSPLRKCSATSPKPVASASSWCHTSPIAVSAPVTSSPDRTHALASAHAVTRSG